MKDVDLITDGWENIKPDFVNEKETKWWVDEDMNAYVKTLEEKHKIKLHLVCWFVERKDGYRTRIVIKDDKPIYENQLMESVAVFIDIKVKMETINV